MRLLAGPTTTSSCARATPVARTLSLEIWQSPLCFGDGFNFTNRYELPPGIHATSDGHTLTPNGPPTHNYTIPSIMGSRYGVAWYFLARYSLDGCRDLSETERLSDNTTTCGLVHEFYIAYTLARGNETAGYYTMRTCSRSSAPGCAWRETQHYYPRIQAAYREAQAMYGTSFNYSGQGDWAHNLSWRVARSLWRRAQV
jgi:hypothetical protein